MIAVGVGGRDLPTEERVFVRARTQVRCDRRMIHGGLHLVGADIDGSACGTVKSALVHARRVGARAGVDRGAPGRQRHRQGRPAVVGQWPELGIEADDVSIGAVDQVISGGSLHEVVGCRGDRSLLGEIVSSAQKLFPAMIVLISSPIVPNEAWKIPPPATATLLAMVVLWMWLIVPLLRMPPPSLLVVFPEMVELTIVPMVP